MKQQIVFLLLLLFVFITGKAQTNDTSRIPVNWKNYFPGIRLGLGLQKAFFTEAGISLQRYKYHRSGFLATTWYAAFEWKPATRGSRPVSGIKVGAEMVNNGGTAGIEVKYQYGSDHNDVVITPKYGIGIGAATLFYGYNISTQKRPFINVGRHQFSLSFNTNILFYHMKYKDQW